MMSYISDMIVDSTKNISSIVKNEILDKYGSQSSFCRKFGYNRTQLSAFLNNRNNNPRIDYVLKLLSDLCIKIELKI